MATTVATDRAGNSGNTGRDGGFNGSDGKSYPGSYPGGKGSGIDVTKLVLTKFNLTPGKAGIGDENEGGGGGGILVNGEKPSGRGNEKRGEGFGGGGSSWYNEGDYTHRVRPGCILIEVLKDIHISK